MELGQAIHARRAALGLTLEALATRAQVSRAMLSAIERGTKNPTIKVLCQIAEGLACSVSQLIGEHDAELPADLMVVREDARTRLIDPRSGVERHNLAPSFQRRGIEVLWYMIPPGRGTGAFPPHRLGVEEHITVVQGRLHCRLGGQELWLEAGDSIAFQAQLTHAFHNPGPAPCHYFLIIDASRLGPSS